MDDQRETDVWTGDDRQTTEGGRRMADRRTTSGGRPTADRRPTDERPTMDD
ncbi:hypothetical protein DPMN_106811 [Dreissena polymorpha]|uniref:Uncharacterized protein n=1 Tax=Dreissena polymorpha TaxID=45954 RepID=A0A9D4K5R4_DREPO|nr:hypothetical protein DPMN_106811 [Dreissena polymorpha]